MLDYLKGINFTDPKVLIPIVIGVVLLVVVAYAAKKIFKFAIIAVLLGGVLVFFSNAPSFKIEGSEATLTLKGKEYSIDVKDIRIVDEQVDGETKKFLVSGNTKIELPFSADFIQKFILDRLNGGE
ncbi:MAG: hypothetical protein PHG48_00225 [Eubacteriales bacterium]|nr:hypothetical protein [Eubacteriales bacterium]